MINKLGGEFNGRKIKHKTMLRGNTGGVNHFLVDQPK